MKKLLLAIALSIAYSSLALAQSVTSPPFGPNVQFRGVRATSTQSVSGAGTAVKVQLNSITIDTGSYWDGTNFWYKPLVAGTYEACGSVYVTSASNNITAMEPSIVKNGTSGAGGTEISDSSLQNINGSTGASAWSATVPCTLVAMNGSTDTLELDIAVIATSPVVQTVRSTTQMSIRWISP